MKTRYHVVGLGNAIMDVIAPVPDALLTRFGMDKGTMALIDQERALTLDGALRESGKAVRLAGGSAANTMVGLAELGLDAAYIGKVGRDETGRDLARGYADAGVHFSTSPTDSGTASARSMIAVTPDGERTMNTFLGASVEFDRSDVDDAVVRAGETLYLEGYLFDAEPAKRAFVHAAEVARAAGRQVALTLSDPFCVTRHRDSFAQLVSTQCDLVFANLEEIKTLAGADTLDAALDAVERPGLAICVTRGELGSVISDGQRRYHVPAAPVSQVVDTTGAGDQYAAGVLAGRALGLGWEDAGYLGSVAAAEVIGHYGPRPETPVHEVALSL